MEAGETEMTQPEAQRRTDEAVRVFEQARCLTWKAVMLIQHCIDVGVHESLGMREDEWLEQSFKKSA